MVGRIVFSYSQINYDTLGHHYILSVPTVKHCYCGNKKQYKNCCKPIHDAHKNALTAEQLMRARFSAYATGLTDFIINTYHPSCHAEDDRAGIEQAMHNQWTKLVVLRHEPGETESFVEYKAYFVEDGQSYRLEERSRFVKENGLWYYIDGEFPGNTAS